MQTKTAAIAVLILISASFQAGTGWSATCLTGSCHRELATLKYLHGPVAAEQMGGKGCVACHVPAGAPCSQGRKGVFRKLAPSIQMCEVCHSRGTGTQHSNQKIDCLKCHDPHGSDRDQEFSR